MWIRLIPAAIGLLSVAVFAGACSDAPEPGPTQPATNATQHGLVTPSQPVLNPPPPAQGCARQTRGWTTAAQHHTGLGSPSPEINGVTSHGSDDASGSKDWPCYVIYTVDFTKGTDVGWSALYKDKTLWVTVNAPYNQSNAGNWKPGAMISGSPTQGGIWLAGHPKVGGAPATVYTVRLDQRHKYAIDVHPPKGDYGQKPTPGITMQLDIKIAK